MEPENQPPTPELVPGPQDLEKQNWPASPTPAPDVSPYRGLRWIFIGDQGLRAGWSVAIFVAMVRLIGYAVTLANRHFHFLGKQTEFTASSALVGELVAFLVILSAVGTVALIERRSISGLQPEGSPSPAEFLLRTRGRIRGAFSPRGRAGLGRLAAFWPAALTGTQIFQYAALWGGAFLLVGCVEEGTFRCYLQFTLTRGINFWWALACIGAMCLPLVIRAKGNGAWGVYAIALLGLVPCALLHLNRVQNSSFWQAAWVTSTLFGFVHTGNNGENWIGIFAAAFIGFVFCVSVRVTGSAWWAIGCHAAWDWAETYFYGTADSGFVAKGHFLSTTPTGNPLWSGGSDGPEGSLLVIGVSILLLAALLVIYGPRKPEPLALSGMEQFVD